MPRAPRLELPNVPMHVTQRGVNRCALFIDDEDRHHFRYLMSKACREAGVTLHAFVLMDNHVHLLLCASESGAVSQVMRSAGQVYVQAFNARHRREVLGPGVISTHRQTSLRAINYTWPRFSG